MRAWVLPFTGIVEEFQRELPFYLRCTPVTAEKSAYQAARFLRHYSAPFPACFTRDNVVAYLSTMASTPPDKRKKAQREASTVNDVLKGLRRFARWAVAREHIEEDPTCGIKFLKVRDRVILAPEPVDVRKVLQFAREYGESPELAARNYAMFSLLADTGIRAEELLQLNLCDLFSRGRFARKLRIRGKGDGTSGKRDRFVPFTPRARSIMRPYLRLRRPLRGEEGLFVDYLGRRMTYPGLRNVLKRICDQTGEKIALHDFRRYAHTQYWLKGISLVDGMALSGHEATRDYKLYIRAAVMTRAVREGTKRSPLAEVLAGD